MTSDLTVSFCPQPEQTPTSFDYTGRASILYSMITGEQYPEPAQPSAYSQIYFVAPMLAIIPLLKTP